MAGSTEPLQLQPYCIQSRRSHSWNEHITASLHNIRSLAEYSSYPDHNPKRLWQAPDLIDRRCCEQPKETYRRSRIAAFAYIASRTDSSTSGT